MSALARIANERTLEVLESIERRVLWLATRIVDYANRERPNEDAIKVGGHQASSASMVSLLTALYVADLDARDRLSVKPHASPVVHALEFLLGRLDGSYLRRLRDFEGLQSYPSRTKDPFPVDFSTGSVGLGSAAPLFAALADRYVQDHFGSSTAGRFISLLGDAELDEGNIWEAVTEQMTRRLGNVLWLVDLNRQSLDRVIPGIKAGELRKMFEALGWNVIELKYGRQLREAFAQPGGHLLRERIDEMPNEQYQSLFGASEEFVFEVMLSGSTGRQRDQLAALLACHRGRLAQLVQDLGGHDLADIVSALGDARGECARPTAIFAYTIKGYGLEIAGRPHNHSALLTAEQIDSLRVAVGLSRENEWDGFPDGSPELAMLRAATARLQRPPRLKVQPVAVPTRLSRRDGPPVSTQAAFGRILLDLTRVPGVDERLVTVSPDVAVSTSLGGFVNKVGVWGDEEPTYDPIADSPLRWRVGPAGQHIELGIAEMNVALLLGQLGLTWDFQEEQLFPIGTLYDPFVMRALEGIVYSTYSGSRFVLAGTPSGVSLSREGGAHQSINTPGIGIETPGLTYSEPAFARELEWLLLEAIDRLQQPDGDAAYLRLSTKPTDQRPFAAAVDRDGEDLLRNHVLAGAFRLHEADGASQDRVLIATCGTLVSEALGAAHQLADEDDVHATVICVSSPGKLYRNWQRSRTRPLIGRAVAPSHIEQLVRPDERARPLVTAIDGHSHSLAWIGGALQTSTVALGCDRFGQAGSQPQLYRHYGLDSQAITLAALAALEDAPSR